MSDKVQLNVQVPGRLASKVRADARRFRKTLDTVGETIIADFYSAFPRITDRARFFEHAQNKRAGRSIGVNPNGNAAGRKR